jgi:hypothetical protein
VGALARRLHTVICMVDLPELRHQAWLWHTVANWSLAGVAIAEALAIAFEVKRFHNDTWSKLFSRISVLSLCVLVYADFKETPMRDAIEHELESIAQTQRESTLRATEELTRATARHEREIKLTRDAIAKVLGIAGDANRRVSNLEARGTLVRLLELPGSGPRAPSPPARSEAAMTVIHEVGTHPDHLKRAIPSADGHRDQLALTDKTDAPINFKVAARPHAFARR